MRSIALLLLLGAATPAFAESDDPMVELREMDLPQIAETGITAFDSIFMKAKAIHDTLDAVQGRVLGAQDGIAVAVGLEEGTPIRMTMWELKQIAGGEIGVALTDGKPQLSLGGAGADEARAMIAAVNSGAVELAGIPNDLAKLPAQVQELVAACQGFPAQLNPQLLAEAGMNPLQLPKMAKQLATNIKAVVATPKRIETLIAASKDLLTGIPQGLAATEPPEAPLQLASNDKDTKEKKEKADKPAKAGKATAVASGSDEDIVQSPITAMVDDALLAFQDAEIDNAMRLLGEADASLTRLQSPIAATELQHLYQTAALVHLVDGNAAAASASVTQALVIDPGAKPESSLGPDYAKLHKSLSKSGIVRIVRVGFEGDGVAYLSGRRVEAGDSVEIAAGKHLLQVEEAGSWKSEVVWVSEGTDISI